MVCNKWFFNKVSNMEHVIVTEHLSKHYRDVKAVDNLDLHVGEGEIYGFLGLNGAGKTSTIRMLLGMIRPLNGKAYILGKRVTAGRHAPWEKTGHMVEIPYSYPNHTVRENLEIIRRLRFIKEKHSVDVVIDRLRLGNYRNRKAKHLSQGNAQRLGLAKALMHRPEILILDEPTNGLDPAGIYEVRELFTDLARKEGVTLFISSHILSEVSRFATRVGIIHQGKLVEEMDTGQLRSLFRKHLKVQVKRPEVAVSLLQRNYMGCSVKNGYIRISDSTAIAEPGEIATLLVHAGHPPDCLQVEEENLESYFLRKINMKGGAS